MQLQTQSSPDHDNVNRLKTNTNDEDVLYYVDVLQAKYFHLLHFYYKQHVNIKRFTIRSTVNILYDIVVIIMIYSITFYVQRNI